MRLASVKPNNIAVVEDDSFILNGDTLTEQGLLPQSASMIDFITDYDSLKSSLADASFANTCFLASPRLPLSSI